MRPRSDTLNLTRSLTSTTMAPTTATTASPAATTSTTQSTTTQTAARIQNQGMSETSENDVTNERQGIVKLPSDENSPTVINVPADQPSGELQMCK